MELEVVTVGALLHDIGKFYQRGVGEEELKKRREESKGLRHEDFSEDFINDNRELLSFLLEEEKISEETLNFLKAVVQCHHLYTYKNNERIKKEKCFKLLGNEKIGRYIKVIEKADNLSAGLERIEVDKTQLLSEGGIIEEDSKDYREKTLLPIFCLVRPGKQISEIKKDERAWGYRFSPLSIKELAKSFPIELSPLKENSYPDGQRKKDYQELWKCFKRELKELLNLKNFRGDFNFKYETLKYLLVKYTWCVPSYTYPSSKEKVPISDIPLADHLLTTAAIATSLAVFEEETNWKYENDKNLEKFILLSLDFSGIQNFIFRQPKETKKWAAKILRARSFLVSLALEAVVRRVIKEFRVNISTVLLSAAGKVWLLLPNLNDAEKRLKRVQEELIKELLGDPFYGEVKIRFAYVKMSERDFSLEEGRFAKKIEELQKVEAEKKLTLFNLEELNRFYQDEEDFRNYFEKLSEDDEGKKPCAICGVSPRESNEEGLCKFCSRLIEIGGKLPNSRYMRVWFSENLDLPPFPTVMPPKRGELPPDFEIAFYKDEESLKDSLKEVPLRTNELVYAFEDAEKDGCVFPVKFLENYVPTTKLDLEVEELRKKGNGEDVEKLKEIVENCYDEEVRKQVRREKEPIPKTFCHLAYESKGPHYLGILKADVDRLGFIFSKGFAEVSEGYSSLTVSRIVALSRMLDFFFNAVVKKMAEEKELYSVFSGGDDLFLIGAWDKIIELEWELRDKFKKFTCENENFTLSVGIEIVKPNLPVTIMAEVSEEALERAKETRNATCVFGKRIVYEEGVPTLKELVEKEVSDLEEVLKKGEREKGNSFLYKLYYLSQLANGEFDGGDKKRFLERFLWRPRLRYLVWRNFKEEERYEVLNILERMIRELSENIGESEDKKKDNLFYIPFAIAVYRRRKNG